MPLYQGELLEARLSRRRRWTGEGATSRSSWRARWRRCTAPTSSTATSSRTTSSRRRRLAEIDRPRRRARAGLEDFPPENIPAPPPTWRPRCWRRAGHEKTTSSPSGLRYSAPSPANFPTPTAMRRARRGAPDPGNCRRCGPICRPGSRRCWRRAIAPERRGAFDDMVEFRPRHRGRSPLGLRPSCAAPHPLRARALAGVAGIAGLLALALWRRGWCAEPSANSQKQIIAGGRNIPTDRPRRLRHQLAGDRQAYPRPGRPRRTRPPRRHHAADRIGAASPERSPPLRLFRGYAQLGRAGGEQARRRSVRVVPGWMQLTVIA